MAAASEGRRPAEVPAREAGDSGLPLPLPPVKRPERRGVCAAEERRVCCDERGPAGKKSAASARAVSSERVRRWDATEARCCCRRLRVTRKRRKLAVRMARAPKVVPRAIPIVRRFW